MNGDVSARDLAGHPAEPVLVLALFLLERHDGEERDREHGEDRGERAHPLCIG